LYPIQSGGIESHIAIKQHPDGIVGHTLAGIKKRLQLEPERITPPSLVCYPTVSSRDNGHLWIHNDG